MTSPDGHEIADADQPPRRIMISARVIAQAIDEDALGRESP
jgi:hypothetical protein